MNRFLYENSTKVWGKKKSSQTQRDGRRKRKKARRLKMKNLRAFAFGMEGWSWRDSNPRPHKETIRFLHAYSSLRFSRCDKTWTTNHTLIL